MISLKRSIHVSTLTALLLAATQVNAQSFQRGDVDQNGQVEITDPVRLLSFLFLGSSEIACLDAADTNDSGEVDLTDAVFELLYLFNGGDEPAPPFEACGVDPTDDLLGCFQSGPCSVVEEQICDVPDAALGWDGEITRVIAVESFDSNSPDLELAGFNVGNIFKQSLLFSIDMAASNQPVIGGFTKVLVEVLFPTAARDNSQLMRDIERLVDERIAEEYLVQIELQIQGLADVLVRYQDNPSLNRYEAADLIFVRDMSIFQRDGSFVRGSESLRYDRELLPVFAKFATMHLSLLRDAVDASFEEESYLRDTIAEYTDYCMAIYYDGLIDVGNAFSHQIDREYGSRPLSFASDDMDYATRMWRELNAYRRRMTIDVLDYVDLWGHMADLERSDEARLTREIYSDPVGYAPRFLPRQNSMPSILLNLDVGFAPVGVDGSMMAEVERALESKTERLGEGQWIVRSQYPFVHFAHVSDDGQLTRLGGDYWTDMPGLKWIEAKDDVAPRSRLSRLSRITKGFQSVFALDQEVRARQSWTRPETLELDPCNPIVRVRARTDGIAQGIQATDFWGPKPEWDQFQTISSFDLDFSFRDDSREIWTLSSANIAPSLGSRNSRDRKLEHHDFAYAGHVLSNVTTVQGGTAGQLIILGFRRADSY